MTWELVGQIAVIALIVTITICVITNNHWSGKRG